MSGQRAGLEKKTTKTASFWFLDDQEFFCFFHPELVSYSQKHIRDFSDRLWQLVFNGQPACLFFKLFISCSTSFISFFFVNETNIQLLKNKPGKNETNVDKTAVDPCYAEKCSSLLAPQNSQHSNRQTNKQTNRKTLRSIFIWICTKTSKAVNTCLYAEPL